MHIGLEGLAWKGVGGNTSSYVQGSSQGPGGTLTPGPLSVSERVVAVAAEAAAAAAAAAAARAEAAAETARRYLQPWVVVDEYSRWRHVDKEEQVAWSPRGERIFRDHLLPYVPSDISPAIAAAEEDAAAAGSSSSSSSGGRAPVSIPTPSSTNRLAAFFGSSTPSAAAASSFSRHPWGAAQVIAQLRDEIWVGVPDCMKCCVWLHANDALIKQRLQPALYAQIQEEAFGPPPFPESLPGRCPTFSGGLLGLEEDVCGVQTTLKQLDLDGDAPLATWRSAPEESQPHRPGRHHWGIRLRLAHPYLRGVSPCGRKLALLATNADSPVRNPLGQAIRPEFNFWPDTYTPEEREEQRRQREAQHQHHRRHTPKQQQQQQQQRREQRREQRRNTNKEGKGESRDSAVSEAESDVLSYFVDDEDSPPRDAQGRRRRDPDVMGPLLQAANKWERQKPLQEAGGSISSSLPALQIQSSTSGAPVSGAPRESQAQGAPSILGTPRGRSRPSAGSEGKESPISVGDSAEASARRRPPRLRSPRGSSRRHHSASGYDRRFSSGDNAVALGLFGRAHPDELKMFASYMKDRHLQAKRQAEQMREATEWSRDRVAFEAVAAAVMAAAREVDNRSDEQAFRRYYTSTSFDLTQKGLWGQRKPGRRGASESQLVKFGLPKGGPHPPPQGTRQGPSRSFVAFLRRKAGKEPVQLPQSPLRFSQPQRVTDEGSPEPLELSHMGPVTSPGGPTEGGHSGEGASAGVPGDTAISSAAAPSESPSTSRGWERFLPGRARRKAQGGGGGGSGRSGSRGGFRERWLAVSWLHHAGSIGSEACMHVSNIRRSFGEASTADLVPLEGAPNPPRQPVRKKSLLNRLLPGVVCRRDQMKREQQRLDFLSNAMRAGGDPFETNKLAAAAATAAVRDVRRRSSSSTFSDEVLLSAKGAAAKAAVAVATECPPFKGSGLHILPEHEGEEGAAQEGLRSRQHRLVHQRLAEQEASWQAEPETSPQVLGQGAGAQTARLSVGPTPPAETAAELPGEEAPMIRCRSRTMPEKPTILLLPPLPPNKVDFDEQQQQHQQQQTPKPQESPNHSSPSRGRSWKEQIEEADG